MIQVLRLSDKSVDHSQRFRSRQASETPEQEHQRKAFSSVDKGLVSRLTTCRSNTSVHRPTIFLALAVRAIDCSKQNEFLDRQPARLISRENIEFVQSNSGAIQHGPADKSPTVWRDRVSLLRKNHGQTVGRVN